MPEQFPAEGMWLYLPHGRRLHYLARAATTEQETEFIGYAACDIGGTWQIPGPMSRLAMPRCSRCCEKAGVPQGKGWPINGN